MQKVMNRAFIPNDYEIPANNFQGAQLLIGSALLMLIEQSDISAECFRPFSVEVSFWGSLKLNSQRLETSS